MLRSPHAAPIPPWTRPVELVPQTAPQIAPPKRITAGRSPVVGVLITALTMPLWIGLPVTRAIAAPLQGLPQPELFRRSTVIPAGTPIPTRYPEAERVVLLPDETVPLTLVTTEAIAVAGAIVIPAGSRIRGELRPRRAGESSPAGSQFFAETVVLPNGRSWALDATSEVVTRRETIRQGATGNDALKGAAIGSLAASVLAEIFGDLDFWHVLAGAGAGALGGVIFGRKSVEVIVVEPATDLRLTVRSPLEVPRS